MTDGDDDVDPIEAVGRLGCAVAVGVALLLGAIGFLVWLLVSYLAAHG